MVDGLGCHWASDRVGVLTIQGRRIRGGMMMLMMQLSSNSSSGREIREGRAVIDE